MTATTTPTEQPTTTPTPTPTPTATDQPDIHYPHRHMHIDTTFWQHHSIFAATQHQLDQLRHDADHRAGTRWHHQLLAAVKPKPQPRKTSIYDTHRPATRRLTAIIHVGLIPMLWAITTCTCGYRWPCNDIKQHLRHHHGWTTDITTHLKAITRTMPKPQTRWNRLVSRLRRPLSRRRRLPAFGVGGQRT